FAVLRVVRLRNSGAGPQAVTLEPAYGTETTGIEVLEERQLFGAAITIAITEREFRMHDPVWRDRKIIFLEIPYPVIRQVAAGHRHFDAETLRSASGRKQAKVQRGFVPGNRRDEVVEL